MKFGIYEIKPLTQEHVEAMRKDAINFAKFVTHYTPGAYSYWDVLKLIATIDELRGKIPAPPLHPSPFFSVDQLVEELESKGGGYFDRKGMGRYHKITDIRWIPMNRSFQSVDGNVGGYFEYKVSGSGMWLAGSWLRELRPEEIR